MLENLGRAKHCWRMLQNRAAAPASVQASSCLTRPVVGISRKQMFRPANDGLVRRVDRVTCAASSMTASDKKEEERKRLSTGVEWETKLPPGFHWYETMLILNNTLSNDDRDKELAKFEAFLNKEECQNIHALTRGRTKMAFPIKTEWEGIYVLYTYAARRQTAKRIQLLLSNPVAGSEGKLLRHITFVKS